MTYLKKIKIDWTSGTHYAIRMSFVNEGENLIFLVDKSDFTLTIPASEYMRIGSIVEKIVQIFKDDKDKDNPFINEFLAFLRRPENKEQLHALQRFFREFH